MTKQQFILIGIDDNQEPCFPAEVMECLRRGKVFSGGLRHHEIVKPFLPQGYEWITIATPLDNVFSSYREHFLRTDSPIVVFASGDPLFFGFANTIMREMPDAHLRLYPSFNSLQLLAHRIPMRYDDMRIVSLTGRPWRELDNALISRCAKIGILTDRNHTPAAIASRLLEYGYTHYNIYVGECLGNTCREKVRKLTIDEAARTTFAFPNNVILQTDSLPPALFGIPDESFEHLDGRSRMITKMPIRLLTLQALELPRRRVFWDIGFCTGSVSIEARLQFPHLQVCSFEVRPECNRLMLLNSQRFGAPGIQTLIGDFLQADITELPPPDAVFIGGHGGKLKEMLHRVKTRLQPGGCVVFNSVSSESRRLFEEGASEAGLLLCPSLHITVNSYNPIVIMKASLTS